MLTSKQIAESRKPLEQCDRELIAAFKALGDATRFRIFRILSDHPKISVSTIAKILHITVPLASQHIKVLTHARLLEKTRIGKHIFSALDRRNTIVRSLVKTTALVGKRPRSKS